jgi:hypothetical protein
MKKNLITLIFSILFFTLNAKQKICYVRITTSDCINCYAGINAISQIDTTNIEVLYVLKNSDKPISRRIFADVMHKECDLNKIIFSDSIFNKLSTYAGGTVHLFVKSLNKFVFEYDLCKLVLVTDFINHTYNTYETITTLPTPELGFSPRVDIKLWGDKVVFYDYFFNEVNILNKKDTTQKQQIKGKYLAKPIIYQVFFGDTISQKDLAIKQAEIEKYRPMTFIDNLSFKDDTMFIFMSFTKMIRLKEGGGELNNDFGILKLYDNKIISAVPISTENALKDNVDINQSNPFYIDKSGNLLLSIFKIDPSMVKETYFLGNYKLINNTYFFENKLPYQLPKEYKKYKLSPIAAIKFAGKYIYFTNLNQILDTETNKYFSIEIPEVIKYSGKSYDFYSNYTVFDLKIIDDTIFSILNIGENNFFVVETDLNTQKTIKSTKLRLTSADVKSSLLFTQSGAIIYLNQNNQLVEII